MKVSRGPIRNSTQTTVVKRHTSGISQTQTKRRQSKPTANQKQHGKRPKGQQIHAPKSSTNGYKLLLTKGPQARAQDTHRGHTQQKPSISLTSMSTSPSDEGSNYDLQHKITKMKSNISSVVAVQDGSLRYTNSEGLTTSSLKKNRPVTPILQHYN